MGLREDLRQDQRRFAVWVGVAAAAHFGVLLLAVALQLFYLRTHPPEKIVEVSLVALPGVPGAAGGPPAIQHPAPSLPPAPAPKAQEVTKVPEPKKIPEPKTVPQPVRPSKTVPEKVVQTRTDKDKANISDAVSRLRQQVQKKEEAQALSNSIADLRKKTAAQARGAAGGNGPAGSTGSGSGGGGNLYGKGGGAVDPYKSRIAGIITGNWSFSQPYIRNAPGMKVYAAICIMPNGTISQIRFDRKSSSEYLNNSVKIALQRSSPLPALPREYGAGPHWVGFVFTPEGIQ